MQYAAELLPQNWGAGRRAELKRRLLKKYRNVVAMPRWDEDELDELGPDLARHIRIHSNLAEHLKKRLGYWSPV